MMRAVQYHASDVTDCSALLWTVGEGVWIEVRQGAHLVRPGQFIVVFLLTFFNRGLILITTISVITRVNSHVGDVCRTVTVFNISML